AEEVRAYIEAAVKHYRLDVRLNHAAADMIETDRGWHVRFETPAGAQDETFDFVVVATGHHTKDRAELPIADREAFRGEVLLPHEIDNYERFAGQRVAVIGLGKTAVDIATFTAAHARQVDNIFRVPRWLIPTRFFGRPMTRMMASRSSAT